MTDMIRAALAAEITLAGLLLAGCQSSGVASRAGADAGAGGESPSMGVAADQARIRESVSTMDEYDDEVMLAKIEAVREAGLYDPDGVNSPKVGEPAPDFELMPLKFYDFQITPGITKDNAETLFEPVRLSSFRGSLPVVLIFGSYT